MVTWRAEYKNVSMNVSCEYNCASGRSGKSNGKMIRYDDQICVNWRVNATNRGINKKQEQEGFVQKTRARKLI